MVSRERVGELELSSFFASKERKRVESELREQRDLRRRLSSAVFRRRRSLLLGRASPPRHYSSINLARGLSALRSGLFGSRKLRWVSFFCSP